MRCVAEINKQFIKHLIGSPPSERGSSGDSNWSSDRKLVRLIAHEPIVFAGRGRADRLCRTLTTTMIGP